MNCVKKITDAYNLEKILFYDHWFSFYDHRFNKLWDISTTVGDLAPLFFGNIQTEVIKIPKDKGITETKVNFKKIINVFGRLKGGDFGFIYNRIFTAVYKYRFRKFCDAKKTILISEPLYELEFLISDLSKYNILYYDFKKAKFLGFEKQYSVPDINLDFYGRNFIKKYENPFMQILLKEIKEDFINNINRYLNIIYLLEEVNKEYPISLGVWGVSPAWGARAMIFEYLRSNNIKVIGSQHGCLYGEIYSPWQFDTDFNKCNFFISWGFTEEDLERIYPLKKIDTKILPFGKANLLKSREGSKRIDLLFPITMSLSIFWGGMDRLFPDKLTERQIVILKYLNSLELSDIYVKPFVNSDSQDCTTLLIIKRLKNLKVVDNVCLTDFLLKYSPKVVLIEIPSQPLFDVLPLDTEIFLMGDPVNPYEKRALEELKRRVHYCEDVNEAISKMDLFFKGKLEEKRDDAFYKHYMYKERTEEKILNLIDSLIA